MKSQMYVLGETGLEAVTAPKIEVGQIIFLNGYGQTVHDHERLAVYKIEETDFGTNFKCVNLDKPALVTHDHVRPVEKLHGIGIYYKAGDTVSQEVIDQAMPAAIAAENAKKAEQHKIKDLKEERQQKAKIWWAENTPKWATSFIVAEFKKDESDSMSDYFHASTQKRLLLAWSASDRMNFKEMRQAALNAEETKSIIDGLEDDKYHRICGNYYHGWTVKKYRIGSMNSWNDDFVADPENIRLPKESASVSSAPAPLGNYPAACKLNKSKGGIEIYFNSKPSTATLDHLKANGFRWGKFNKCWYRTDCEAARRIVEKYAAIPEDEETNQDGLMVEANENAGIDNWAQQNL